MDLKVIAGFLIGCNFTWCNHLHCKFFYIKNKQKKHCNYLQKKRNCCWRLDQFLKSGIRKAILESNATNEELVSARITMQNTLILLKTRKSDNCQSF